MAEESAPPPPGGEVETGKKKLRLKVTQVKENTPRVRRRVISAVPAAIPGVQAAQAVETDRVGAGRGKDARKEIEGVRPIRSVMRNGLDYSAVLKTGVLPAC